MKAKMIQTVAIRRLRLLLCTFIGTLRYLNIAVIKRLVLISGHKENIEQSGVDTDLWPSDSVAQTLYVNMFRFCCCERHPMIGGKWHQQINMSPFGRLLPHYNLNRRLYS